ncbi:protein grindelwald [Bactrocera neohumeralis]|uniref:protein grindelwald n=1 Tax=Bactrocera neohumeralis TaxID=98809 RepID=UPI0021660A44|nr:protein grindelwald [Bactrocera neohumeralis]XP_050319263.1 protein grindelwald [Bactrocera neohumeralis]XP_050319264.1 protein grindelwald [Bactrocera neohumeralis]XP_050319265.1 protein grindelwald [Bactrocera neohumeralis]XP_050319266.1 protein grindelwald [Bactrocera neohumeralis]XP_050319268.1 protein grindelwald [Bactrocera neohumeralis]XP_050319269.1 protein grindelwald [Bactrocera neohumeralis]XP_050319270.1 protein grindelwald [Bactrocera neohumeralis]XP_050319271.1 protein grin
MPFGCSASALALRFASLLLPTSLAVAKAASGGKTAASKDCHGKICRPVEEYCSNFLEGCDQCEYICNPESQNFHADTCARECADYKIYDPLKAEIHSIHEQQNTILILLIVLLTLIAARYMYKCICWLRRKRFCALLLKKLHKHHEAAGAGVNSKDMVIGATIPNVMAINGAMERAPSQIYSVTGAEGSVMTLTTPVSTRYPAENSTPSTTVTGEYSYDNQALAVTPVSEKPNGSVRAF